MCAPMDERRAQMALVHLALAGDAGGLRRFVDELTPIVQARVARALSRSRAGRAQARSVEQEIEDLTQEVFVALFDDDARALRAWDPARGLSLPNFVGLVAEHQVATILRSGRRNPWKEEPTVNDDLDRSAGTVDDAAPRVESRDFFARLLDRLRVELTPRGLELFGMLLVEGRSVEDACERTGMSADAVYAWRSRLGKIVRRLAAEMDSTEGQEAPR
jgi:RNA polymerase sigma-70 factor (ECF subfamily)